MQIHRAFKTELKLNNKERGLMNQYAGLSRFAFNWGLARRKEAYEHDGTTLNAIALHKELVKLKKEEFAWMYNYSKSTPQAALRDLDTAFQNFFRRVKQGAEDVGYPKFKSRHTAKKTFKLEGVVKVENGRVRLPRIGWLRLKERGYLPVEGVKILSATLSERAGRWFVSLQVRMDIDFEQPTGEPVGVDVGIKTLAAVSNGDVYENPKAAYKLDKRLARAQRGLARKVRGSSNYKKQKAIIAKRHFRISNIRKDALHKASSGIVAKARPHTERPVVIVLEDLNVSGMMKNGRLARALSDAAMSELDRQIAYKAAWLGETIERVSRWYPSSKLCSACGHKKMVLSLSERTYHCEACGMVKDRDRNAADNLKNTASSVGIEACGDAPLGVRRSRKLVAYGGV